MLHGTYLVREYIAYFAVGDHQWCHSRSDSNIDWVLKPRWWLWKHVAHLLPREWGMWLTGNSRCCSSGFNSVFALKIVLPLALPLTKHGRHPSYVGLPLLCVYRRSYWGVLLSFAGRLYWLGWNFLETTLQSWTLSSKFLLPFFFPSGNSQQ